MLDPADLKDFTGLGTSSVVQRQTVSVSVGWEVVRWHLEGMYGEVEEEEIDGQPSCKVRAAAATNPRATSDKLDRS